MNYIIQYLGEGKWNVVIGDERATIVQDYIVEGMRYDDLRKQTDIYIAALKKVRAARLQILKDEQKAIRKYKELNIQLTEDDKNRSND